jgi:hypothetical protein
MLKLTQEEEDVSGKEDLQSCQRLLEVFNESGQVAVEFAAKEERVQSSEHGF